VQTFPIPFTAALHSQRDFNGVRFSPSMIQPSVRHSPRCSSNIAVNSAGIAGVSAARVAIASAVAASRNATECGFIGVSSGWGGISGPKATIEIPATPEESLSFSLI
jgi:hypothetical protein